MIQHNILLKPNPIHNGFKNNNKNAICFKGKADQKPLPTFAIVDLFDKKTVDIDGDKIKDLSHGELIQSIVEAQNAKTITFKIDEIDDKMSDLKSITTQFKELARQIREKEIQVDAVNLSYYCNTDLPTLNQFSSSQITTKNIHKRKHKKEIIEALPYSANTYFKDTYNIIKAIEEVTAQGIPVYVCAGNHGSGHFNLLTLAKGSISVGNMDKTGDKRGFTADNSLVKRWAQGVFNISPVKDKNNTLLGYDITGTGKAEVPAHKTSGGVSKLVEDFYSKPLNTLFATTKDYQTLKTHAKTLTNTKYSPDLTEYKFIPDILDIKKLFNIDKVAQILGKSQKQIDTLKQFGDYTSYTFSRAYKTDPKTNRITNIDYDRTGRQTINIITGTSYSAPMAMVEDNKKKNAGLLSKIKLLIKY